MKGKIKWYKDELSYGFITSDDGVDHFFHKSQCTSNHKHFKSGSVVHFNSEKKEKGMTATSVRFREHEDPRVTCPSCERKIRPNTRYSDGMIVGSTCPYCFSKVESVSTSTILWHTFCVPIIVRGIIIAIGLMFLLLLR